jgi:colicin import membrane protein
MRKAFRLRSQGQPFKMMGAEQLTQQEPPQPLYSNPNDPAMQQQQRSTPMMQVFADPEEAAKQHKEYKDAISGPKEQTAEEKAKADADAKAKAKADAKETPDEKTEPKKSKTGSKILKGAADIITGGLDRVYGSGKTNLLANEKAAEYAAQKSADAKKDLAEKRAHELEVIKLGKGKGATFTTEETDEQKAERKRKEELARTTNAINKTSPAAYKSPAKQVDPSMIMGLVGSMGGGKKEEEKKEQPNWKANVKVSD